jgi:4-hydroxybenzoate polyprenyltransferase
MPVGGIAVALMLGTSALLQISVSPPLLLAGFCGTALVYGVDRALTSSPEDVINRPDRHRWVEAHRGWLQLEMGLLLIAVCAAVPFLQTDTLLVSSLLVIVVALHLVPGSRWGRPLQKVALAKPVAVVGAWAVGSVILPLVEEGAPIEVGGIALAGYRMVFILPNVLLADWGDRKGDAAVGLATGLSGSLRSLRIASTLLLGGGVVGAVAAVSRFGAPVLLLVDALGLLVMLGAVWTVRPGTSPAQVFLLDLIVAWPLVSWLVHQAGLL